MVRRRAEDGSPGTSAIAVLHDQLLAGEVSCEEQVEEELRNIESYNQKLNAFITIFSGHDGLALSRARFLDSELATSKGRVAEASALFGVPITIKDNTFLGGFATTNGSIPFSDFVPTSNALIVDQLLEAGCVPLGKTNLHELALGIMGTSGMGGPIHNPVDSSRISGGSSGGAAVSVALAKGPILGTGSDTGGSVRVPAALCGVCGFKPSHGVLSTEGLFPLSGTLDHSGLFARTVPDLLLGFHALTGGSAGKKKRRDVQRKEKRPAWRVGVPTSYFTEDMDSQVSKDFWRALDTLRASEGFEVVDVQTGGEDYRRFARARAVIQLKEAAWFYESILRSPETRKTIHKDVLTLMDNGLRIGMMRYMAAQNVRLQAIRSFSRLMKDLDLIGMPMSLIVAPKIDDVVGKETGQLRALMLRNAELFNLTGLPALSLPMNASGRTLPTGLQLVGPIDEDESVLAAAGLAWQALHEG